MLLVLSWRAQSRQAFTDPRSADLWSLAFYLAALGGLLLVLWLVWSAPIGFAAALPRLRAAARGALPAARRQWRPRNDRRLARHLGARVARACSRWPVSSWRCWPSRRSPGASSTSSTWPGCPMPAPGGPRDRVDVPRRGHGAGPAQGVRRQRRAGGLRGARPSGVLAPPGLAPVERASRGSAEPARRRAAPPGEPASVPRSAHEDRGAPRRDDGRLRGPPRGQDAAPALHGLRRQRQGSARARSPPCRFNRRSAARSSITWSTCSVP